METQVIERLEQLLLWADARQKIVKGNAVRDAHIATEAESIYYQGRYEGMASAERAWTSFNRRLLWEIEQILVEAREGDKSRDA